MSDNKLGAPPVLCPNNGWATVEQYFNEQMAPKMEPSIAAVMRYNMKLLFYRGWQQALSILTLVENVSQDDFVSILSHCREDIEEVLNLDRIEAEHRILTDQFGDEISVSEPPLPVTRH